MFTSQFSVKLADSSNTSVQLLSGYSFFFAQASCVFTVRRLPSPGRHNGQIVTSQTLALHLLYWLKVCWWSTLQRCDRRYMFVKLLFDRFPSVVQLGGIYVPPSASSAAYNSNSSCWCVTDFRLLVIRKKKMLFKINCSRAAAKIAIKRIPVFLKTDFPE